MFSTISSALFACCRQATTLAFALGNAIAVMRMELPISIALLDNPIPEGEWFVDVQALMHGCTHAHTLRLACQMSLVAFTIVKLL